MRRKFDVLEIFNLNWWYQLWHGWDDYYPAEVTVSKMTTYLPKQEPVRLLSEVIREQEKHNTLEDKHSRDLKKILKLQYSYSIGQEG
jgi:hypothetical protein